MSIRRNDQAQAIWLEIQALERQPVKDEEGFKWKKREMGKLMRAYERATGVSCSPANMDAQQARGDHALMRKAFGQGPEHATADDLNNLPDLNK